MIRLPVLDRLVDVQLPSDPLAARVTAQYIASAPAGKERLGIDLVRRPQVWADSVASSTTGVGRGTAAWAAQVERKIDALRGFWRLSRQLRPAWLDDSTLMAALLDGRLPDGSSSLVATMPNARSIVIEAVAAIIGHHLRACAAGCDACDAAADGDWTGALQERGLTSDPLWDLLTALQRAYVVRKFKPPAPAATDSSHQTAGVGGSSRPLSLAETWRIVNGSDLPF